MFHDSERDRTFRRIFGCCGNSPVVDNISANAVTVLPGRGKQREKEREKERERQRERQRERRGDKQTHTHTETETEKKRERKREIRKERNNEWISYKGYQIISSL